MLYYLLSVFEELICLVKFPTMSFWFFDKNNLIYLFYLCLLQNKKYLLNKYVHVTSSNSRKTIMLSCSRQAHNSEGCLYILICTQTLSSRSITSSKCQYFKHILKRLCAIGAIIHFDSSFFYGTHKCTCMYTHVT